MNSAEVWESAAGYEGLYEISNFGRVKALGRTYTDKNGRVSTIKERILKLSLSNTGYWHTALRKNGASTTTNVHRLIAEAFIANPENKPCVNHIDGDKANNDIENLEWVTHRENMEHAAYKNLMKQGTSRSNAKLNDEKVRFIRENSIANGGTMTFREIARIFNVSSTIVTKAAYRETWKHVG